MTDDSRKTKELGQKLLQGWTMLAESCPFEGCNVPLVEKKKDQTILCVSCGNCFKRQETEIGEIEMIAVTTQKPKVESTPLPDTKTTSSASPKPAAAPPSVSNATSFTDMIQFDQEAWEKKSKKMNETTSKMGEKLLQGWAMLQESCPKCSVPLMRDKEKRMICMSCGLQVLSQDEYDPAKHRLATPSEEGDLMQNAKPLQEVTTTKQPEHQLDVFDNKNEKRQKINTPLGRTEHRENGKQESNKRLSISHPISASVGVAQSPQAVHSFGDPVQSTLDTLYAKLWECQNQLASSANPKKIKLISSAIVDCANAISALQKIKRH